MPVDFKTLSSRHRAKIVDVSHFLELRHEILKRDQNYQYMLICNTKNQ